MNEFYTAVAWYRCNSFVRVTPGIAAKIINKMQSEEFINAYLNKGRMRTLVEQIAVYLVTNDRVGVLGAMSKAMRYVRSYRHNTVKYDIDHNSRNHNSRNHYSRHQNNRNKNEQQFKNKV